MAYRRFRYRSGYGVYRQAQNFRKKRQFYRDYHRRTGYYPRYRSGYNYGRR